MAANRRPRATAARGAAGEPVHYHPPGPVARGFLRCDAFIAAIMGPIGSGKSTAAVMKLLRNAQKQTPSRDGVVRRRSAVIRNTYPELKTTTIKTWHQWVPADRGWWNDTGPPTHFLSSKDFEWEVIFVALDRPDDVRKLLSMELSDAWINEAREVPKAILDGLTGRVGRYPPRDGEFGCVDPQILMDTNPPDSDHWYAKQADFVTPELQAERERLHTELVKVGSLRPDQPLVQYFRQPGGRAPDAENLQNLDPGYYLKAMVDKTAEWIKVYVDAEYGYVQDGRPVYPEYKDSVHCREFELNPRLPLEIGLDFGLTPAALFGQMPGGQWRWRSELVTERMGMTNFAQEISRHIATRYPGFRVGSITGDPAGNGSDSDERTAFQILKANGIEAVPAKTNEWTVRRDAVALPLTRMVEGEPGLLLHPDCRTLRKGMIGAYNLRRIQVAGDERYKDQPDKNMYSHICEAGQYLCLGGGEGRVVLGRSRNNDGPRESFAISDYDIFGG